MLDYVNALDIVRATENIGQAKEVACRLLSWLSYLDEGAIIEDPVSTWAVLQASVILAILQEAFKGDALRRALECDSNVSSKVLKAYDGILGDSNGPVANIATLVLRVCRSKVGVISSVTEYLNVFLASEQIVALSDRTLNVARPAEPCGEVNCLVDEIFQLKNIHIRIAIDRLLEFRSLKEFQILSLIVNERKSSPIYRECSVIRDRFCQHLRSATISPRLLEIASKSAYDDLLLRILAVSQVGKAFNKYLIELLKRFRYCEDFDIFQAQDKQFQCISFDLLISLVGKLLNLKRNPIKKDLHAKLNMARDHIDPCIIEILNNQRFVLSCNSF